MPNNSEALVFVKVNIDNLKEFSKLILSKVKIDDKIKIPKIKKIKTKKIILMSSSKILLSGLNTVLLNILEGFVILYISFNDVLNKTKILKNFRPEEVDKTDPPTIHSNNNISDKSVSRVPKLIPEVESDEVIIKNIFAKLSC